MVDRVADISSSVNLILESIYKKPITIIRMLEDAGVSESDINSLQSVHIERCERIVIDSIDKHFQVGKYYRDFQVVSRRFGLNGKMESLESIGNDYGITRQRVRQIQNRGLKKITSSKLKRTIESKVLTYAKNIFSSFKKHNVFATYDDAKAHVLDSPGLTIVRLDNDMGYLAKVVKNKSSVAEKIESKPSSSNTNTSSQNFKTVEDYLKSMSLRYFAENSQCVTHRIKHCILNEVKDFVSLYEFLNDNKTRRDVLRIKHFGRKSFKILNECVENYIENIKIKIRKNERSTANTSNESQANNLKETEEE